MHVPLPTCMFMPCQPSMHASACTRMHPGPTIPTPHMHCSPTHAMPPCTSHAHPMHARSHHHPYATPYAMITCTHAVGTNSHAMVACVRAVAYIHAHKQAALSPSASPVASSAPSPMTSPTTSATKVPADRHQIDHMACMYTYMQHACMHKVHQLICVCMHSTHHLTTPHSPRLTL